MHNIFTNRDGHRLIKYKHISDFTLNQCEISSKEQSVWNTHTHTSSRLWSWVRVFHTTNKRIGVHLLFGCFGRIGVTPSPYAFFLEKKTPIEYWWCQIFNYFLRAKSSNLLLYIHHQTFHICLDEFCTKCASWLLLLLIFFWFTQNR